MAAPENLPVVVAGAGPTGLMCALALAKQGIPVVVCEAEPGLTHDLRAGSFHPPTQEMMAPYGITARMHETGLQVRHWQIRERRGDLVAQFDLGLLADVTPFPYRLHLEQHRLTPIQLDILRRETDAHVHFNHRRPTGWRPWQRPGGKSTASARRVSSKWPILTVSRQGNIHTGGSVCASAYALCVGLDQRDDRSVPPRSSLRGEIKE